MITSIGSAWWVILVGAGTSAVTPNVPLAPALTPLMRQQYLTGLIASGSLIWGTLIEAGVWLSIEPADVLAVTTVPGGGWFPLRSCNTAQTSAEPSPVMLIAVDWISIFTLEPSTNKMGVMSRSSARPTQ